MSGATGPTYTCCDATSMKADYQPGDTLAIHWIVVAGKPSGGGPTRPVELDARLQGPYPTATDLKRAFVDNADPMVGATFAAAPVRPSGQAGEQPVSLIPIPPTARPAEPGSTASGASIVQVIPKT